jgi:hypothetical protein
MIAVCGVRVPVIVCEMKIFEVVASHTSIVGLARLVPLADFKMALKFHVERLIAVLPSKRRNPRLKSAAITRLRAFLAGTILIGGM